MRLETSEVHSVQAGTGKCWHVTLPFLPATMPNKQQAATSESLSIVSAIMKLSPADHKCIIELFTNVSHFQVA